MCRLLVIGLGRLILLATIVALAYWWNDQTAREVSVVLTRGRSLSVLAPPDNNQAEPEPIDLSLMLRVMLIVYVVLWAYPLFRTISRSIDTYDYFNIIARVVSCVINNVLLWTSWSTMLELLTQPLTPIWLGYILADYLSLIGGALICSRSSHNII